MAASTTELILRFTGDSRQLKETIAQVRADLSRMGQSQATISQTANRQIVADSQRTEAAKLRAFQQSISQIAREEQRRITETVRSANQRLREEQRTAREIARITAETARQATQQERIRERAARSLADAQIREARRAARELERSIAASRSSGGGTSGGGGGEGAALLGALGQVPRLGALTSQLNAVTSASASAGAAQASMAGPIGIVVAAFLVEVGAAAALTKGLFEAAQQTAAFRGALFDMSQQVGVSVETLSGLEILAKTTGGSIETVAASLAIFQRNLEQAEDPTSREGKLLADLGVTATDTEEALRQTITALFEMGEGSAQTDAALQLFGRSGRFVNAILKESHGDLDKAIAKFRELGIIVSTEDAKAADEFNDTIALLQFQLRGIVGVIGGQVMPVVLRAFEDARKLLKENRELVEALGVAAKIAGTLIFRPLVAAINGLNTILEFHRPILVGIVELYERWAALIQLVTRTVPNVDPNAIPAFGEQAGSGLELLEQAQKAFLAAREGGLKPFNLREIFPEAKAGAADRTAERGIALLKQLQTELRRLSTETKAEEVAAQLLDDQFKGMNASLREQILIVAHSIDLKKKAIEVERQVKEEQEKSRREIDEARQSLFQFISQQKEVIRQLQFGDKTAVQQAEEFIALFPKWVAEIKATEVASDFFWLKFNANIIDSTRRMKEMLQLMREWATLVPEPGGPVPVPEEVPIDIGLPPPPDISLWKTVFAELKAVGMDALSSLALGVGSLVEQWVILGSQAGVSIRKLVASVLAGVAAQAAVLAVMELAYAIAALTPWGAAVYGPAAAHFKSAALFGSIALGAGLAGRAAAGNSFQSQTTGGGGGSAGGMSTPAPLAPTPVNMDRATQNQQAITVLVKVQRDAGSIVEAVVENHRDNGPIRQMILSER